MPGKTDLYLKYSSANFLVKYFLILCLLCCGKSAFAQPTTLPTSRPSDTSMNKSNNGKWKDEEAKITYQTLNSERVHYLDTSLHGYQRSRFLQTWARDLGNSGAPAYDLMFTPEDRVGPSLGYHIFDRYRFNIDSLKFYNTNRPYSVFDYQIGGKLEQLASIMHSQNILPNWNFAVEYRKINAPGNYKTQRNNHDNFSLTTRYKSLDQHYTLFAAMVYNKEQHDENGGISNDSDLTNPIFSDRKTIETPYQSGTYSLTRSPVFNIQRDFTAMIQHTYSWGVTDTSFDDDDTTKYSYRLTPRFSITHKTELSSELHAYKDLAPDSIRYVNLFDQSFANHGTGYYGAGGDSVFTQQKWFWADTRLLLNGFIGKEGRQLKFSAGPGIRYDQFISSPVSNVNPDSLPKIVYYQGYERKSLLNSYLMGEIKKEALVDGQWEYGAAAKFFYTGDYAGNFVLNASIGKELNKRKGSFVAGAQQQINSAPYSYTNYENVYTKTFFNFDKESVTTLYATIDITKIGLSGGVRNYVINNYIYLDQTELPVQRTAAFTIPQVWIRKVFKAGNFYLDNQLVYQQVGDQVPINVPALMARHQFSFEKALFNNALKLATGFEIRYNTTYTPSGYNVQFNKFFYQNTVSVTNAPEVSVFFNFRIKRFRAFIMGDNLQQVIVTKNAILFTGTPISNFHSTGVTVVPVYAAPNAMLRFGFSWAMVN
jgi:hypothetical protein